MGKGYAEGPAAEEAERVREELARGEAPPAGSGTSRLAVHGSTAERPEKHFIGWVGEVDPDALFASGAAWGLSLVRHGS